MGEVYEGWDEELQRRVALKVLNDELAADPQQLANFKEEGRALARLHHKNVVTVHTLGQHDGRHFIAMEYVNGSTIHHYIKERKLDVRRTLLLFVQALEGLRVAHEAGVIHRDLKPHNIMVHTNGTVKLVDFGLSKIQTQTLLVADVMRQDWGTAEFTAPEVLNGHPATKQSDIFSMGVVFEVILDGNIEAHPQLASLFARMTSVLPPSRPQSVDEVIGALNKVLRSDGDLSEKSEPLVVEDATVVLAPAPVLVAPVAPQMSAAVKFLIGTAVLIGMFAVGFTGISLSKSAPFRQTVVEVLEAAIGEKGALSVSVPQTPVGTKFKYLYKFDSADGGFTNELTREWEAFVIEPNVVEWRDDVGGRELFSRNPFLPPIETKISPLRSVGKTEYLSNPLKVFPLNSKEATPLELREVIGGNPAIYTWSCWLTGHETLKTHAGTFAVDLVSCMANGAKQGVEIFKYAPSLNHWVYWERHGFGLPKMSAELIRYSRPK